MMVMRIVFVSVFAFLLCSFELMFMHSASAQEFSINNKHSALLLPNIQHAGRNRNDYFDMDLEQPIEPHFKQVKFINQPPPKTLSERVDRLIHGIKIDIPPQYDHYGYEIRRYMKSILTPHDLHNSLILPEKIKNAKTARVILEYWKKSLNEEMSQIEVELEKGSTTPTLRTTYRYNAGIVNAFIADAYLWIDKNIEFLEFLRENSGEFYVNYPFYDVPERSVRTKFTELYKKREEGLNHIIVYSPFRAMIY
jgi:hypothetical protein